MMGIILWMLLHTHEFRFLFFNDPEALQRESADVFQQLGVRRITPQSPGQQLHFSAQLVASHLRVTKCTHGVHLGVGRESSRLWK